MRKSKKQLSEELLSIIENKGRCDHIKNVRISTGRNEGLCGFTKCYLASYCRDIDKIDQLGFREDENKKILNEAIRLAVKKRLITLNQIFDRVL